MPRKKKAAEGKKDSPLGGSSTVSSTASASASPSHQEQKPQGSSSVPKATKPPPAEPSTSALIICRNKHWRYISSFHGPWLQLPPEILESLAYSNYATPQPQPIHPAVFFDLIKIRQLVEEATDLAVRAANGTISSPGSSSYSSGYGLLGGNGGTSMGGSGVRGARGDGTTKLSRERRHRMREHATQKLSKAYALDEIAASVATMQSTSSLEEVAKLVLQRNENDCDAKYVHFFHEKIPSRSLVQCTSLKPLDDIITMRQLDGAIYRTRAVAKMLKDDLPGAVRDLTDGLAACRACSRQHDEAKKDVEVVTDNSRRKMVPSRFTQKIDENDQPSGLEIQLLFHRAGVYLSIACQHIHEALTAYEQSKESPGPVNGNDKNIPGVKENGDGPKDRQAHKRWLDARKVVKTNARRALRDYLAFLSLINYTPGPTPSTLSDGTFASRYKIYPVSDLFSSTPPVDLPPYPEELGLLALRNRRNAAQAGNPDVCHEAVTYHPLLTDALHSLLICHSILQTPEKEFVRHAHMVARIARICDGYPIFLAPRSPSRSDWMEILYRTNNWLRVRPWEDLCAPAPLPGHNLYKKAAAADQAAVAAAQQGILPEPARTAPPPSVQEAMAHDSQLSNAVFKRWAQDDSKDFPFCTERAVAVSCWVRVAPVSVGTGRNKGKKNAGSGKSEAPKSDDFWSEENQILADEKAVDAAIRNLTVG
ncbi:hypothetical protein MGYG_04603 [Nannizzia gypsea CBS 118893]|uniref:Histidine kinase group protein n=1 Tax=Arthroderma gypseum (strain ATCC MYA-4604 / CBS 118893) TaxID=535722 RepID=E4UU10_ARTGP|nr:hypothetical protein MGYG_04603 [Nannizzia gypsea CBS 118893]EFR01600.1 hypothetical protein MGYG_04603 [Nannizzia gypsea CBS 118893]